MPPITSLLWVNKSANSKHLSRSSDEERLMVFSQAQRSSRPINHKKSTKKQVALRSKGKLPSKTDNASGRPSVGRNRGNSLNTIQKKRIENMAIPLSPTNHVTWTNQESRSLEFYLEITTGSIITFQRDKIFWGKSVPTFVEHFAAIRHLVVAIAATHELLNLADTKDLNKFALVQCNKAIGLLRETGDRNPRLLLVSCILFSAYNLLRCDLAQVDKNIESGLNIATSLASNICTSSLASDVEEYREILGRLGGSHGYKLWTHDIMFKFEHSRVAESALVIDTNCVRGPFMNTQSAIAAYRLMMSQVFLKIMRNMARGAYIDPNCALAQEMISQISQFIFHWQTLYTQLPTSCEDERRELKQVRVAFNAGCLVFYTKIISPVETALDAHSKLCDDTLDLADEILLDRRQGRAVTYIDRLVNGILFSVGMSSRGVHTRSRAVAMLHSQANYEDGHINWIRGTVADLVSRLQERVALTTPSASLHGRHWINLAGLSCKEQPRRFEVEYRPTNDSEVHSAEFLVDWAPFMEREVSAEEIDHVLQGIMAAYRMYGKPHASQAPDGVLRVMEYRGRVVPVRWSNE